MDAILKELDQVNRERLKKFGPSGGFVKTMIPHENVGRNELLISATTAETLGVENGDIVLVAPGRFLPYIIGMAAMRVVVVGTEGGSGSLDEYVIATPDVVAQYMDESDTESPTVCIFPVYREIADKVMKQFDVRKIVGDECAVAEEGYTEQEDSYYREDDTSEGNATYKIWTIQSRNVVNQILSCDEYQPDFSKSNYLKKNPGCSKIYDMMLHIYHEHHWKGYNFPGFVFGFLAWEENGLLEIRDYEEFQMFIRESSPHLKTLWNKVCEGRDMQVLELECSLDTTLLMPVDLNDFQFLMPPMCLLPPYSENSVERILTGLEDGQIYLPEYPSYVAQVHVPNIRKENLVGVYPVFDI